MKLKYPKSPDPYPLPHHTVKSPYVGIHSTNPLVKTVTLVFLCYSCLLNVKSLQHTNGATFSLINNSLVTRTYPCRLALTVDGQDGEHWQLVNTKQFGIIGLNLYENTETTSDLGQVPGLFITQHHTKKKKKQHGRQRPVKPG